ncbi:MAG: DUF2283 domain-containing protein [Methanohalobium sp.]|uniref:DUF2283 domain-containing protein n=1 Tax=Methanohalobium sp. TaxID=2837493 RepID=UPI00397A627C
MIESSMTRTGDGIDYDFEYDIIYFYSDEVDYKHSIDLDDVILDIGEDDSLIGVQIINASKKFKVPKHSLREPKKFNASVKIANNEIKVELSLTVDIRNNMTPKKAFALGDNDFNLPNGTLSMAC